ncbi:MAG: hypothetical protein AAF697_10130 [Pseudomonadota bacterium]
MLSRAVIGAAAASMAFAPIAVQANTRAGDSAPVYTNTSAQPGTARSADGENVGGRAPGATLLLLFSSAAAIAGIVIAVSNGDGDQSPGT